MDTLKAIRPITEVKRDLMKLLKELQRCGGMVAITKDGRAAGVLMSMEEYEGLMETIDILQDRILLRSLHQALKEYRQGKLYSHRQVFGE